MKILLSFGFLFLSFASTAQNKPKVIASASIFADMTKVLAGDLVDIESIVPIGSDPHLHEPTPRDAKLVTAADLILVNGLTFEGWLNELIENAGTSAKMVLITEGISPIQSLVYQNSSDPHAWMSARNGIIYIENIKNALLALLPNEHKVLEFNFQTYKKQLEDLDLYIENRIKEIPENQRILITSHDAFQYYGRRYGLRLESILGISTEAEAQTSDIQRLNKVIRTANVPAVFIESTVNPKLLQQIAKDNKVSIGGSLFADSIGDADSKAPTYYDMLKYNTDTIVEALKQILSENPESRKANSGFSWILGISIGVALALIVVFWIKRRS
jgi:ABC-type Zn uptake system ZnuABC Zn-binding protein ZnuA